MSIEDFFADKNKYYSAHKALKEGAAQVGQTTSERLKKLLPEYFWNVEMGSIQISDPRVKTVASISRKMEKKEGEIRVRPEQSLEEAVLDHIEDFVGIRIVVASKRFFPRLVEMVREDKKCWDVIESFAYTQDAKEISLYEDLELAVNSKKVTGYCGIHFVLSLHGRKTTEVRKVEIQIRTKFQDAWQSFEHPMYKIQDKLPKKIQDIRNGLARQSEATAESYETMLEYSQELASEKKLDLPDQMRDWGEEYGRPLDYVWEVVFPIGTSDIAILVISPTEWIIMTGRETSTVELLGDDWKEKARVKVLPLDLVLQHFFVSRNSFEAHSDKQKYIQYVREKHGLPILPVKKTDPLIEVKFD